MARLWAFKCLILLTRVILFLNKLLIDLWGCKHSGVNLLAHIRNSEVRLQSISKQFTCCLFTLGSWLIANPFCRKKEGGWAAILSPLFSKFGDHFLYMPAATEVRECLIKKCLLRIYKYFIAFKKKKRLSENMQ